MIQWVGLPGATRRALPSPDLPVIGRLERVKVELQRADVIGRIQGDLSLLRAPFIQSLGPKWSQLVRQGQARRAADRAVIFQQGEPGESLLFVLGGAVRLLSRKATDTVELGLAHAGDVVGELEVMNGAGPRSMSAFAAGPVEFLEIPHGALLVSAQLPRALEAFLRGLSAERRKALDEMTDFLNRW